MHRSDVDDFEERGKRALEKDLETALADIPFVTLLCRHKAAGISTDVEEGVAQLRKLAAADLDFWVELVTTHDEYTYGRKEKRRFDSYSINDSRGAKSLLSNLNPMKYCGTSRQDVTNSYAIFEDSSDDDLAEHGGWVPPPRGAPDREFGHRLAAAREGDFGGLQRPGTAPTSHSIFNAHNVKEAAGYPAKPAGRTAAIELHEENPKLANDVYNEGAKLLSDLLQMERSQDVHTASIEEVRKARGDVDKWHSTATLLKRQLERVGKLPRVDLKRVAGLTQAAVFAAERQAAEAGIPAGLRLARSRVLVVSHKDPAAGMSTFLTESRVAFANAQVPRRTIRPGQEATPVPLSVISSMAPLALEGRTGSYHLAFFPITRHLFAFDSADEGFVCCIDGDRDAELKLSSRDDAVLDPKYDSTFKEVEIDGQEALAIMRQARGLEPVRSEAKQSEKGPLGMPTRPSGQGTVAADAAAARAEKDLVEIMGVD